MTAGRTYLDWNASAPLAAEAREAVAAALELCGNASSVHREGRAARALIEAARAQVADFIGSRPVDVIFTSGGTEANNLALRGLGASGVRPQRLLMTGIEHTSVREGHGFTPEQVFVLPVDSAGRIDLDALDAALDAAAGCGERALLALQLANNETGVIQPLREAADLVHARGGLVLADCVQAAGRLPLSLPALGADAITISGHKFGAPKGVGALVLAGPGITLTPLIGGGGQELNRRAGTENVSGIAGMGAAAEAARQRLSQMTDVEQQRDSFEAGLRALAPDAVIFGAAASRLPNTSCYALPGARAEMALIAFDLDGVAVSSGAACSSGKVKASHVLAAMGVARDLAECAIRVSLGHTTARGGIDRALASIAKQASQILARKGQRAA